MGILLDFLSLGTGGWKMENQEKFRDYIKNIFLKYSVLTIVLIFLLYSFSLYFIFKVVVVKNNQEINHEISSLVQHEFAAYENGLETLAQNHAIEQVFTDRSFLWEVNEELYEFRNEREFKANFALIDDKGTIITTSLYKENADHLSANYLIKELIDYRYEEDMIQRTFHPNVFKKGQSSSYYFAKPILVDEKIQGYLLLFLEDLEKSLTHTSDLMVITDRFNYVIYSSDQKLLTNLGKLNQEYFTGNTASIDGNSYYVTSTSISSKEIQVVSMTSMDTFNHSAWMGVFTFLGIASVVIMLIYLALPKIMQQSLRSFDALIDFIHKHESNQPSDKQRFEEFQIIQNEFSEKLEEIQSLIKANEAIAETKRKMEIKQLETQFNPHFAFNVLEMLRYEILFDPENASEIVVSFANILRYNIHYGSTTIPLETDIKYVQDYLKIQKARFNERFDFTLDVDKDVLDIEVPKLIIQPIIENSIKHCIEHTKHLKIAIMIKKKNDHIFMSVEDNGQGIEKEKLLQIKQMLLSGNNESEHYGLFHSHRVIQLLYGKNYGLSIASTYGKGTTVQVKISLKGELMHV